MLESLPRQQMSAPHKRRNYFSKQTLWSQPRANSTNAMLENNLVVAGTSDS